MTQTDAIQIYDRTYLAGQYSLATVAKYLAKASDKERARFLRDNPATAAALATV